MVIFLRRLENESVGSEEGRRECVCVVMKRLSSFEFEKVFCFKINKINEKWALDTTFKTFSSLTTIYYPTAQKPSIKKPFRS